jgi:hypothetical protein
VTHFWRDDAACTPTPGQRALQEAARLEAARYYGDVLAPAGSEPFSVFAARAEAELEAALERQSTLHDLTALIDAGTPTSQIVADYGFPYEQVRAARKSRMKNGAA